MQAPANPQERLDLWHVLGGVRFALAVIVVFNHWPPSVPGLPLGYHLKLLSGATAVICFLVISGFSIAHSIERSPRHFYRRRLLRIYPLYVLALAIGAVVESLPGGEYPPHTGNFIANLFFLQTYFATPFQANGVVWSLGVEVGCYALAPLLQRANTPVLLGLTGISALAFAVYPHLHWNYYGALPLGGALLFLGWAWLAGFLYYRHRASFPAGVALLMGMIILTTFNVAYTERLQHITIIVAMGLLVLAGSIRLGRRASVVLNYLGDLSYPLYLVHAPIMVLCIHTLHWRSRLVIISLPFLVAALGLVVDLWLRKPFGDLLTVLENATASVLNRQPSMAAPAVGPAETLLPGLQNAVEVPSPGEDFPSAR